METVLIGNKFFKTSKGGLKAFGVGALNVGIQGKHFARYTGANEAEVAPSYHSKPTLQNSRKVLSDRFQIVA
ncbi:MAG: hypothetical protein ACI4CY_03585 [Candidatus Gastranaerophilaceae bacterium]